MISLALAKLAEETQKGGLGAPHADHNHVLVGVAVFMALVVCLLVTLAFNRDR
ncbi:MAG: hypothetical protein ACT4QF_16900 [Sporichthyaceae bacterium]|jgi:hypothetical protein